ncbi:MAG: class I SAM-dependent methyltransferase [Muribaculaceae bacterium]|nr:class I SAM-dependent methyltransferase [Muribaculaceae bacterium]
MTTEEILFFDRLSDIWDDNEVLSTSAKILEILSELNISKGMEILDLGTGTGVLLPFLSSMVGDEGKVTALDISAGMLKRAKKKHGNLFNVTFIKQDFEKDEVAGKYDLILLYCVFPHVHFPEETLKRLVLTNLKEKGRIVIAFPADENFINGIHREKKAASELLPSAPLLSLKLREWGFESSVIRYDEGHYSVEISGFKN